jgi:hypothetical protein
MKLNREGNVEIRFVPQDMWIGLYVDTDAGTLYFCFVPCFPLIIRTRVRREVARDAPR